MSSSWFMPKNAGESIKWIKSPCFFCCCNWRCSCPPCFEAAHSPPGSSLSTTRGSLTWDADGLRPTYGPKQLQVLCHFLPQPSINQFFKTKTYNCLTIIHPHPILKFHMVFLFTERSEVFFAKKNLGTEGWYTHGLHRKPPCHVLIGWSRWPVLTLVRLLKFQCTNLLLHTVCKVLIPGAEPDYHLHRRQLSFHC